MSEDKSNDTVEKATAALNKALINAVSGNKKILLLLSGGSSLALPRGIDTSLLSDNFTISVLDERYSTDPAENNMAQIMSEDFYTNAIEKGCNFIDTRVRSGETQDQLADRFNQELTEWLYDNPDGEIIATVGIGPDGHISGIMPFPENPSLFSKFFDKTDRMVVSYDANGKNPYRYRVTTTMNLLRRINTAIVFVSGENKRGALMSLFDKKGSLAVTPARILREKKDFERNLFTDVILK